MQWIQASLLAVTPGPTPRKRRKNLPEEAATIAPEPGTHAFEFLTRAQALEVLGVKRQTLYSYVSRGLIRSTPSASSNEHLYLRQDVEQVRARSLARSGHGPVAAAALQWGEPVLGTAITEITPHGPRYRKHLALDLCRQGVSFEAVCDYLWQGELDPGCRSWNEPPPAQVLERTITMLMQERPTVHPLQLLAGAVSTLGILEYDRDEPGDRGLTTGSARRLLRALAGIFGCFGPQRTYLPPSQGESVAACIARGLSLPPALHPVVNQILVLLADHELTPATFTARIAASSGSHLHACVAAALNAHQGIAFVCDTIERFFRRARTAGELAQSFDACLRSGSQLPGFNHRFYPDGDPRAEQLIQTSMANAVDTGRAAALQDGLLLIQDSHDARPSIENGLALSSVVLGMPEGTAGALFAIGRAAGWIAHTQEQRDAGYLIRPRSQFHAPG